jgi:adenylate cyclase
VQRVLKAIQERKIDRVAAAYGVAAWILVQAASIGLPTFGAPAWIMKVMIVVALVGFPLALWIAWHVAAPVHGMADEANVSLRRTDMALLAVLAVLIVVVAAQFAYELGAFHPKNQIAVSGAAGARSVMQASATAPAASIAVLPFLNLSGDPKKDFFSDGISEELLNDLANAPRLRVAARTSCFAFKGKNEDIRKIAQALNVGAILEGSVREDGQHIRITAQLINAADGYHIWSKTYDRDLSNILQVQDEIAQAITAALTHTLNGGSSSPPKPSRPAIDPDAYRDYLKAQALSALKTDEGDAQAVALLKTVTAREPKFAAAFAALGRTYAHMVEFHAQRQALLQAAEAAAKEALRLDPKNLEALSTALYVAGLQWNWSAASADARNLLAINPHNIFTLRGLNYYYSALGFPERQTAVLREATRLDPLSFVDLNNLAANYNDRGQFARAASAAQDALALRPDRPLTLYSLCWAYAGMNRLKEAQTIADRLENAESDAADACRLHIAVRSGHFAQARQFAVTIAARFPGFTFQEPEIALFYALANDFDSAISWLNRAYRRRDGDLFALAYAPSTPAKLLTNPGWKALMAQPAARAWQTAHDQLAKDLRRE